MRSASPEQDAALTTTSPPPPRLPLEVFLTATVIFGLDWITPLGFAVYMLYVPLCLTCLWRRGWRFAFMMGGLCSALILFGFVGSPSGHLFVFSIPDRSIALLTLWASLWGGKLFAHRTFELERIQAILQQEARQRERAESKIRGLAAIVESSTDPIMNIKDGVLVAWNPAAEQIFGYSAEEILGQPINLLVPAHRTGEVEATVARAMKGERIQDLVTERKRKDGSLVPVSLTIFPVKTLDGQIIGCSAIVRDITERKKAEEILRQKQRELERYHARLQDLSSKLLRAQDQERQRIARELHDDMTQRLAALAVDVGSLEQMCRPKMALLPRLRAVQEAAGQLADDVHSFAYRLHPPQLEHIGLEAAIHDHIDEFGRRSELPTQFKLRAVPQIIPIDIATCLYRVMQESLQNILKHAEASKIVVRLLGTCSGVGICIQDDGKGFVQEPAGVPGRGLGLLSLEERVRLLNGKFRIHTEPGCGTEVHAWIPLVEVHSTWQRNEERTSVGLSTHG
ncbi:MAG: PAS domain S-box protein [Nitrospira sp.]|nr:PAS domain S-box protein [Nitrospira sp.]